MKLNLKEKNAEQTILIGAYMYQSVRDKLDAVARANGLSVSNVIRTAINDLLDKENA